MFPSSIRGDETELFFNPWLTEYDLTESILIYMLTCWIFLEFCSFFCRSFAKYEKKVLEIFALTFKFSFLFRQILDPEVFLSEG